MKKIFTIVIISSLLFSCGSEEVKKNKLWIPFDESNELIEANKNDFHKNFKLISTRYLDKNIMLNNIENQLSDFSEEDYKAISKLIENQDITTLQQHVENNKLSYKWITQWYLFRILKNESSRENYLNAIISINPKAVEEATLRDELIFEKKHPIYGMPILLKDNINAHGMPTTAGSISMINNYTNDAFIVKKLIKNGALILGKTNLSEWANFISSDLPNGFSAVGGQTINPHGRMKYDTGGSSSGSAVSVYANYAVAAVGTETSGSISSPSSANSIVGLKPSIGLLSRGGIVPISSTLDTPGPMSQNVRDNAILLSAMMGEDPEDSITISHSVPKDYYNKIDLINIKDLKLGVISEFKENKNYLDLIEKLNSLGVTTIEIEESEIDFSNFMKILNYDMKRDLPFYIENYASSNIKTKSIEDFIKFNNSDSLNIPYGQDLFIGIRDEKVNDKEIIEIKAKAEFEARKYFNTAMDENKLDAILSINNWKAGEAAYAKHPTLSIPMGYDENGVPISITIITKAFDEEKIFQVGYCIEKAIK